MAHLQPLIDRINVRDERAASLVEYVLLIAFIALACIAALTALGPSVSEPYSGAASGLG